MSTRKLQYSFGYRVRRVVSVFTSASIWICLSLMSQIAFAQELDLQIVWQVTESQESGYGTSRQYDKWGNQLFWKSSGYGSKVAHPDTIFEIQTSVGIKTHGMVITKMDSDNNVLFRIPVAAPDDGFLTGAAMDQHGDIYLGIRSDDDLSRPFEVGVGDLYRTLEGQPNSALIKLDANGEFQWITAIERDKPCSLISEGQDRIYHLCNSRSIYGYNAVGGLESHLYLDFLPPIAPDLVALELTSSGGLAILVNDVHENTMINGQTFYSGGLETGSAFMIMNREMQLQRILEMPRMKLQGYPVVEQTVDGGFLMGIALKNSDSFSLGGTTLEFDDAPQADDYDIVLIRLNAELELEYVKHIASSEEDASVVAAFERTCDPDQFLMMVHNPGTGGSNAIGILLMNANGEVLDDFWKPVGAYGWINYFLHPLRLAEDGSLFTSYRFYHAKLSTTTELQALPPPPSERSKYYICNAEEVPAFHADLESAIWCADRDGNELLHAGPIFQPSLIQATNGVYLFDNSGACRSEPLFVSAVQVPEVSISYNEQQNVLMANPAYYEYRWYYEDNALEQDQQYLKPVGYGEYKLELIFDGCLAEAVFSFTVQNTESSESFPNTSVYPNPTQGNLFVKSDGSPIERIQIWDASGKQIFSAQLEARLQHSISLLHETSISSVFYLQTILTDGTLETHRILANF